MGKSPSKAPTDAKAFTNVVFLFGSTGVGKTELLLNGFSDRFSVINADSIQVYRHLDIGSAKASPAIRAAIPHYVVDVFDPWQQFSVGDFLSYADDACRDCLKQGRIPVISGGTAYYFKHFLYGLSEAPPSEESVRLEVLALMEEHGNEWAHRRLAEVDPVSASRINVSDGYRISRALEVYRASGRPLSSFALPTKPRYGMQPLIIGLRRDPEELRRRIEERVERMFSEGLEDEMRNLLAMGARPDWPGMQGIGYREFFLAMESGELSRSMIGDLIVRNSRRYAKRQMTFFRSFTSVTWLHPEKQEQEVVRLVDRYLAR